MTPDDKRLSIDLDRVIREKNPTLARFLPRFVLTYLKRIIHQEEINRILEAHSHLEPIAFIRAALADMKISYQAVGIQTLPREGRYLFASNHPFGGMDGMMLCDELNRHFGPVKIIVNDILMQIKPLAPIFIPINKHGRQKSVYTQLFRESLRGEDQIITFPAGLCSRRHGDTVRDPIWKTSFIKNAIESQRDIVPVYFEGELSPFFYNLSRFRTAIGLRANIEMLYLPDEMFRQTGKHFNIYFGKPIPWQQLANGESAKVWSLRIREWVYTLKYKQNQP